MPREAREAEMLQEWEILAERGQELYNQCLGTTDGAATHEAVECFRKAVSMSSQGIGDVAWSFSMLADTLQLRFDQVGDRQDLSDAIRYHQQALDLRPPGHPDRSLSLNNLSNALWTQFKHVGDRVDLDDATRYHQEGLELTPPGHPDRPFGLNNLANALLTCFEQGGDHKDLDDAIRCYQGALDLRLSGNPDRSSSLMNLANALVTRFEQVGDRKDLDNAIMYHQEGLDLTQSGHPDRSLSFNNLGNALRARFKEVGDRQDLDDAIRYHQEGLELTPLGHPDRSFGLNNLANALLTRFEQIGDRKDLDDATRCYQVALNLTPSGHANHSSSLTNLAIALVARFNQMGDRKDLDDAIKYHQEALVLTPLAHPDRSLSLNNLGNTLLARFKQVRDRVDLDDAIRYHQEGLDLGPIGHPDHSLSLNNLANTLLTRFEQTGDRMDLEDAIRCYQGALDLRPPGHPNRSPSLMNLANALVARFEQVGDCKDIDDAIRHGQEGLDLTPLGHPDRSLSLKNLVDALLTRFQRVGDRVDLDRAISYGQEVVEQVPSGHLLRSNILRSLALALSASLDKIVPVKQGDQTTSSGAFIDDLHRIFQIIEEATYATTGGPPGARLRAAFDWVKLAMQWSHSSSLKAYRRSLELMEGVIATGSSLESRHLRLTSNEFKPTQTLVVDAAACAIGLDHVKMALEMLEQGRSLLLNQAGRYRTPVEGLEATLAVEFQAISTQMEISAMNTRLENVNRRTEDAVADYQKLSADWARIVEKIRAIPGFGSFLLPIPFTTLQAAAAEGPVIVVNLSKIRSDAVIVTAHGPPLLVPLEAVTPDQISDLADRTNSSTSQNEMKEILNALWHLIVQPIAKVLVEEVHLKPGSQIWWCPTGAASLLPLHAAGDYRKRSEILPDLFISSYTATLTSLIRARAGLPSSALLNPDLVVIEQSQDPTLRTVGAEIEAIRRIAKDIALLDEENATSESTLRAMTEHSWVHLACHGMVDEQHPFKSHFRLYGEPLTLLDIARQNLPHAYLAFLSSCHSAEGNRQRPDEVLHLAAAVQFAGFRSAVGTLWAVDGEDGPIVAEAFYSNLLGSGPNTTASSAVALHRAVQELRKRRVPNTRWACFVHYGR